MLRQLETDSEDELDENDNITDTPTRPVRAVVQGRRVPRTAADDRWLQHAYEHDVPIEFEDENPKRKGTASYERYEHYKLTTTIRKMCELTASTPRGKVNADLKYDYERGWVRFPGHEPNDDEHYCVSLATVLPHVTIPSFNDIISAVCDDEDLIDDDLRNAMADLKAFAAQKAMEVLRRDPATGQQFVEPTTFKEAMAGPDAARWRASMQNEYDALIKTGTFVLVPRAECAGRPIGCKWVFKLKCDKDGNIAKWKSRLVAKGFSEILGQSYEANEVYAPVCSYDTLRTMLSVANQKNWNLYQADISNAYLQSDLPRPQYMQQPPGFEQRDENGEKLICRLQKGLYGTKSGGYHWYRTLNAFMKGLGFKQLTGDACFYQLRVERPEPDERAAAEGGLADTVGFHGEPPAGELWVITHANDLTYYRDGHDCTPEVF